YSNIFISLASFLEIQYSWKYKLTISIIITRRFSEFGIMLPCKDSPYDASVCTACIVHLRHQIELCSVERAKKNANRTTLTGACVCSGQKKKETIGALERRIGKYAGKIHASDLDYIFPLDFLDTPCFPSESIGGGEKWPPSATTL
ncbi:Protein of unknown function, partial [Cotesia congregata]